MRAKIAVHPTFLPWIENLNEGTPQQIFIDGLSATSTEFQGHFQKGASSIA